MGELEGVPTEDRNNSTFCISGPTPVCPTNTTEELHLGNDSLPYFMGFEWKDELAIIAQSPETEILMGRIPGRTSATVDSVPNGRIIISQHLR